MFVVPFLLLITRSSQPWEIGDASVNFTIGKQTWILFFLSHIFIFACFKLHNFCKHFLHFTWNLIDSKLSSFQTCKTFNHSSHFYDCHIEFFFWLYYAIFFLFNFHISHLCASRANGKVSNFFGWQRGTESVLSKSLSFYDPNPDECIFPSARIVEMWKHWEEGEVPVKSHANMRTFIKTKNSLLWYLRKNLYNSHSLTSALS